MKNLWLLIPCIILFCSCGKNSDTTQVAEDTFVHKNIVYRIIDNEVTVIGDLKSDSIREFQVIKPVKRDFGQSDLSFVKQGAFATLDASYRGNFLYFNLNIFGLNDNYLTGSVTVRFLDEFGYVIHSTKVATEELTGLIGANNSTITQYFYNGKTEMSNDIYSAIKTYSVSAALKRTSSYYDY